MIIREYTKLFEKVKVVRITTEVEDTWLYYKYNDFLEIAFYYNFKCSTPRILTCDTLTNYLNDFIEETRRIRKEEGLWEE